MHAQDALCEAKFVVPPAVETDKTNEPQIKMQMLKNQTIFVLYLMKYVSTSFLKENLCFYH